MTSTACEFSYSGSTTSTRGSGGATRTRRGVGSNSSGQQARWKVENGQLMLCANGVQWVPQPMKIENNSNGHPIVTTGGKEYMMCK
ncbi:MAG: hypothetical protein Q7S20_11815 [Gemmatimonadaceae bacterium]|nr:hypothetical protein [Gemmatimonadaceae bacterium]